MDSLTVWLIDRLIYFLVAFADRYRGFVESAVHGTAQELDQ